MLRAPTMTSSPPSDPGVLRLARADDVDEILTLIAEHSEQLLPRGPADIDALLETFWVVETPEGIVGCCCLEVYSSKIAEVRSLAVRASARGRGYGARLVATAVAEAKRRGIPQVLVVTSNLEFFSRQHFKPCLNEKFALFWEGPEDAAGGAPPTGR